MDNDQNPEHILDHLKRNAAEESEQQAEEIPVLKFAREAREAKQVEEKNRKTILDSLRDKAASIAKTKHGR